LKPIKPYPNPANQPKEEERPRVKKVRAKKPAAEGEKPPVVRKKKLVKKKKPRDETEGFQ